jgi:drug/metabolite transporter (DMT)-like permease
MPLPMLNTGYLHLAVIYLFWGMTYLAIRIGVSPQTGFPPYAFGAWRCLIAAGVLLAIARLRGQRVVPTKHEWRWLIFTGLGMWTVSHGMVLFAEQFVGAGFAALAVSGSPLWVLLIDAAQTRQWPGAKRLGLVLLGILGIAALMLPEMRVSRGPGMLPMAALLIAAWMWAYCAWFVQKHPIAMPAFGMAAYQHLFGGMGFVLVSFLLRESSPMPGWEAWGALAFLVVFGSLLAFTSYLRALSLLPVHIVTTNTFVNPVIAMLLGVALLGEKVTAGMVIAILLVTISVTAILYEQSLNSKRLG